MTPKAAAPGPAAPQPHAAAVRIALPGACMRVQTCPHGSARVRAHACRKPWPAPLLAAARRRRSRRSPLARRAPQKHGKTLLMRLGTGYDLAYNWLVLPASRPRAALACPAHLILTRTRKRKQVVCRRGCKLEVSEGVEEVCCAADWQKQSRRAIRALRFAATHKRQDVFQAQVRGLS